MAESAAAASLSCSICLEVFKCPVTLPCGHSYCKDCINIYWDHKDRTSGYSCPQCRGKFNPRPVLNKNSVLLDLMMNMTGRDKPATPQKEEVGLGVVECDFCIGKKLKAVKSCLVCLASYCETHLQPHFESAAFKRHKLVEVSASIQEKICAKHDKLLEVYCRTDEQCICLLCVIDEHKGHDTVSAAAERDMKQLKFEAKKQKFHHGIQTKEKQLRELKQKMKAIRHSKNAVLDQNEKAYAEIVMMADKRREEIKGHISEKEIAATSRAEALAERLRQEIGDLRRRENEMKQLSLTDDHIYFLQHCKDVVDSKEPQESSDCNLQLGTPFNFVSKAISDFQSKVDLMAKEMEQISEKIKFDMDPKTRQEFSMYTRSLNLDLNTVFKNLLITEGHKITWVKKAQNYPDHPQRFMQYDQVLCSEGLTGVCYWEVEWKGPRVEVAVCYKGKNLDDSSFGYSNQSWSISLSSSGCYFWHSGIKTKVPTPCSSTMGVYLNHKAGIMSFYSVSETGQMTRLHTVHSEFSQPLFPGFLVSRGSWVRIITQ